MILSIEDIRQKVCDAADRYNAKAMPEARISTVSLFGSYAKGLADEDSDIDLLVAFSSPVVSLLTLAQVLEEMEDSLGLSVDLVQDPLPNDALLQINERVSLYEAA